MKNKSRSKFINLFPNNPTMNRYRRGLKSVSTGLTSDFSKKQAEFEKKFNDMANRFDRGLKGE